MTDDLGGRSALVVEVRLPAALEAIRLRHVDNARLGVPAHVTVLFPFLPARSIDRAAVNLAGEAIAQTRPFEVEFREIRRWDPGPTPEGVLWLPPEPAAPFIELTKALAGAFPDYVPYGGIHAEVIPHLTLANAGIDAAAREAGSAWSGSFRRRTRDVSLLVEDDVGRWRTRRRLPLAGSH